MIRGPNRILALVVAGIVVIGVVAAVLSATRDVPAYDRATPEGVVQGYLTAVIDRDNGDAVGFLAADSRCTVEDLDRSYVPEGVRVVLRDTRVTGSTARLRVDVVTSAGGPLDGSGYTERQTFRLSRSGAGWRIDGAPWPMYDCGPER